jgi:hypothetical protein
MSYFVGAMTTLIVFFAATKFVMNTSPIKKNTGIVYRQSHIHEIVRPILPLIEAYREPPIINRQSKNHENKINVKVIIVNDIAYWIKDSAFYMAPMDGFFIDKDRASVVDTMGMDKVELDKMLFIMDELRKDTEQ